MKIEVNGVEILSIDSTQKEMLKYIGMSEQALIDDLKWILTHKLERCYDRMHSEWKDKISEGGKKSIPLKREKFAEAVLKHSDYKDRSTRDKLDTKLN